MSSTEAVAIRRAAPDDAGAMRAIVDAAYAHYVERLGKPPGPMCDDYESVARSALAFVMTLVRRELMHENIAMYRRLGYAATARRVEHGYSRVYLRKTL